MELERVSQLQFLKTQEVSVKRQEELRRQTLDYEFSKRAAKDKELTDQFWKNKSEYKKATKDISLEKYSMRMENELARSKLVLSSVESMVRNSFNAFYENRTKFLAFVSGLCVLTAGLVASKRGASFAISRLESHIMTPKLIRESGPRFSIRAKSTPIVNLESEGLIYNPETATTLTDITASTALVSKNKGFFRNFLFYGPPGTGKTLFAKRLARNSNLRYAIMSGGDVLPLRDKAVVELNKVTNWTNKFDGMLLFLDEADAFLKKRELATMGEEMRSALNSFLYLTGEASQKLMLVLATNKPEHLDRAVTDRIDLMVEFPLPDAATRKKLFEYYFEMRMSGGVKLDDFVLDEVIDEMVRGSEGLSAREVSKLCLSWQIFALENRDKSINKKLILDGVTAMHRQNVVKRAWDRKPSSSRKNY